MSETYHTKPKIVFMGTPEFGAVILEGLMKSEYQPILVVTETDKPAGRDRVLTAPAVKVVAEKYKIPILQPEKILNIKSEILNLEPDLIIVAAYGQILPKEILDIPKKGCLNVHPSLLPKYRGSSPIQSAILNGEKITGVTIILMDEKIDHGPIIGQRTIEIGEKETGKDLQDKLADLSVRLILETIPKQQKGLVRPVPQNENQITYARVLRREDGKINWKKTAEDIERQIRAFALWPECFTFWEKTGKLLRIKILQGRVLKSPTKDVTYTIGKTLIAPQNEICVQCGKGLWEGGGDFLVIEKLQLEGKKETSSEDFLRGYPDFIGAIFK